MFISKDEESSQRSLPFINETVDVSLFFIEDKIKYFIYNIKTDKVNLYSNLD